MYSPEEAAAMLYKTLDGDTRSEIEEFGVNDHVLNMIRQDLVRQQVKMFEPGLIKLASELFPEAMADKGLTIAYTYIDFMGAFWEIGLMSDPELDLKDVYPDAHEKLTLYLDTYDVMAMRLVDEFEGVYNDSYYVIQNALAEK